MASFTDPFGYGPFTDPIARTPTSLDDWWRRTGTAPWPTFNPSNASAPPTGILGDQFTSGPMAQPDSDSGAGLLGSLAMMRNGGFSPSLGEYSRAMREIHRRNTPLALVFSICWIPAHLFRRICRARWQRARPPIAGWRGRGGPLNPERPMFHRTSTLLHLYLNRLPHLHPSPLQSRALLRASPRASARISAKPLKRL
jgi:hypothetical protein